MGVDSGRLFLLVELIEGETLRDKLRAHRPRPALPDLVRWMVQAGEGVASAHDHGIVHRDFKPENILITAGDVVKVIDFGFAKLEHLGIQTTEGRLVGTALYAPPEQLKKGPPHTSWDVYAMGIVLYEALAGVHPTEAATQNPMVLLHRHLTVQPKPLAEVAPGVPADLADIVDARSTPSSGGVPRCARSSASCGSAPPPPRSPARRRPQPPPPRTATPRRRSRPPCRSTRLPRGSARPSTATQPLAAWQAERAAGDRPAQPPPPSTAPVASTPARSPALAATVPYTQMPPPVAVSERRGARRPRAGTTSRPRRWSPRRARPAASAGSRWAWARARPRCLCCRARVRGCGRPRTRGRWARGGGGGGGGGSGAERVGFGGAGCVGFGGAGGLWPGAGRRNRGR